MTENTLDPKEAARLANQYERDGYIDVASGRGDPDEDSEVSLVVAALRAVGINQTNGYSNREALIEKVTSLIKSIAVPGDAAAYIHEDRCQECGFSQDLLSTAAKSAVDLLRDELKTTGWCTMTIALYCSDGEYTCAESEVWVEGVYSSAGAAALAATMDPAALSRLWEAKCPQALTLDDVLSAMENR